MSKRKAQEGDVVRVRTGPDNGRIATVTETEDGHRVRVIVTETGNNIILGAEDWEFRTPR
jgi:ribosomal protein L24